LKTYITERLPKLLSAEIGFVAVVMAKVAKRVLFKTVQVVREEALR